LQTIKNIKEKTIHVVAGLHRHLVSVNCADPVSLSKENIIEYNKTRTEYNFRHLCHAPFANIYFGYEGRMGVCCYNRTHVIGTYPHHSIREAWFGATLGVLRDKIKKYDLSSGCYACKAQWSEKAYKTVLARNYDKFSVKGKYPKVFEFELSNRCNLQCIMCSEENSSAVARERFDVAEKLQPYDDHFIEELSEFIPHLQSAKFLGGEPFLIPLYYKIWEQIYTKNPSCEIVVQTNGTVLNDNIKALLKKGKFSISISVDSLNKETFENIRRNADFDSVYSNLMYFIDFCKENGRFIGIACCFMQQNWKDIPGLINFCNEHQIPLTFNRVWATAGCAVWGSSLGLIDEIIANYQLQRFPAKTPVERNNLMAFNDLKNLLQEWRQLELLKKEKEDLFSRADINILEEQVYDILVNTELSENISAADREKILEKLDYLLGKFRREPWFRSLLIKMSNIPGEILQQELLKNSSERIEQQVKELLEK